VESASSAPFRYRCQERNRIAHFHRIQLHTWAGGGPLGRRGLLGAWPCGALEMNLRLIVASANMEIEMNLRLIVALATVCCMPVPHSCLAQAKPAASALFQQMQSANVGERVRAFYALDDIPGSWSNPDASRILLKVVAMNDSLTLRLSRQSVSAGDKYGEEYTEYAGQVLTRCRHFCDREAYLRRMLAVAEIPEMRKTAIDVLSYVYTDPGFSPGQRVRINRLFIAAAADSTSFLIRQSGLGAMGVALRSGLPSLDDRDRFHRASVAALTDSYLDVRLGAIRRLTELNNPADLPLLRRVADADSAHVLENGVTVYPARDAARLAIAGMPRTP
jgi:hypothetical protein